MELTKEKCKNNYNKERNVVGLCGPEKGRCVYEISERRKKGPEKGHWVWKKQFNLVKTAMNQVIYFHVSFPTDHAEFDT